jgi:hypothetical protein
MATVEMMGEMLAIAMMAIVARWAALASLLAKMATPSPAAGG